MQVGSFAAGAKLEEIPLNNLLVARLEGRVVDADGRLDCQPRRVHLAVAV